METQELEEGMDSTLLEVLWQPWEELLDRIVREINLRTVLQEVSSAEGIKELGSSKKVTRSLMMMGNGSRGVRKSQDSEVWIRT